MDDLHETVGRCEAESRSLAVNQAAETARWFVMRDLKRSNAREPAYKMLRDMGFEIFTPMVWKLVSVKGKQTPAEVPFMQDLLFVHGLQKELDPIVERTNTLQYRFLRGGNCTPMTVRSADMERFITAVESAEEPRFYTPKEITPSMVGKKVRIIGGPLNGYEGRLQKLQGSRVKRMFVELSSLLTVAVEVQPEFIQILK